MSLRRFLVPPAALDQEMVELPAEEAAHARKVLRLAPGAEVELIDGGGRRAKAVLKRLDRRGGLCRVLAVERLEPPRPRLVLCPGLLKGPAMDLLAARLTELAVDEVRPTFCVRSVPRLAEATARQERWQRLAGQALKQCGAARPPRFFAPAPLDEVMDQAPGAAWRMMLYEQERSLSFAQAWQGAGSVEEVWALIGPEGGFTPVEAEAARSRGFVSCGLGPTILRAETASLAMAALVRFTRG